MTTPLLDFTRFPGRRWSAGFAHEMRGTLPEEATIAGAVLAHWSHHLRARPQDFLLFATGAEAVRAAVHALLAPGDVALLARPLTPDWIAAVLQSGARYVDVGRRFDVSETPGGWHASAAVRAAAAHPEAVAIAESYTWGGANDADPARTLGLRAVIADATRCDRLLGPALAPDRAALTLVALRDPDAPSPPVVYALVAPDGEGSALRAAIGPTAIPQSTAERAFAVLEGVARTPSWLEASASRMADRYAAWQAALAGRPGVEVIGRAGTEAAALCLGGDGDAIAAELVHTFGSARAWPASSMRSLLTVDLAI